MLDQSKLDPVHPGEVLAEEFLAPKGLSAAALARHIGVPAKRVSEIVAGQRAITGDTALRLAAAFGTTPEFWMGLQLRWELVVAGRRGGGGGDYSGLKSAQSSLRALRQRRSPPQPLRSCTIGIHP